jgi:sterol desaturase/sphingolipid hydroxylase (fatty acid hydroxylase superfamily)
MDWQASAAKMYWACFVTWFLMVAMWETRRPRLTPRCSTARRWRTHGVLFVMSIFAAPVILRITPVAAALSWERSGSDGLLGVPAWHWLGALVFTFVLLDVLQYFVHRLLHVVPALWRVHEIHHSDPDFDVGTAGRFHPLEVVVTAGAQLGAIALFAPPAWAVFVASVMATGMNLLTHANASLPAWLELRVRRVFMTPDLHRIHHSADEADYSRNFGQALIVWDRLLGTHLDDPALGQDRMRVGVPGRDGEENMAVPSLLARPFESRRTGTETAAKASAAGHQP